MKRMVVVRVVLVALAVVMVGAGGVIASSFTWDGPSAGGNVDWAQCSNWLEAGCAPFCGCTWPASTDDDAIIVYGDSVGDPEVNLDDDYTMDDLILRGPIIFVDEDGVSGTLTVDVFQIQGPAVIEMRSGSTIVSG